MKHLLQLVSQGAADDEPSASNDFTSDNVTLKPANNIDNGLYYFEENYNVLLPIFCFVHNIYGIYPSKYLLKIITHLHSN